LNVYFFKYSNKSLTTHLILYIKLGRILVHNHSAYISLRHASRSFRLYKYHQLTIRVGLFFLLNEKDYPSVIVPPASFLTAFLFLFAETNGSQDDLTFPLIVGTD